MGVSSEPSSSSGPTGVGKGSSLIPAPVNADEYSETFNSDDEFVAGMGDVRLSEEVDVELSAEGKVSLTQHV